MSIVTPRAIVSRWKNFSDSSGLNPAHLMCVTSTIVDFGGVATTSVFGDLGAAPSAATHVEGISMPFDALVVAASCKYVHDAAACDAAAGSTLSIDIMASPAAAESVVANYASVGSALSLTTVQMDTLHWSASATGLTIPVNAGTTIALRSLVGVAAIDAAVNADLSVCLWIMVPETGLGLPTS